MKLHHYLSTAKTYLHEHKQAVKTGVLTAGGVGLIVLAIGLYMYNAQSKLPELIHTPLLACNLLTEQEAKELLGKNVISQNKNGDKATVDNNRATSNCSYTDSNPDTMAVVAVAVRSAINDEGIRENKADFAAQRRANTVEPVDDIGDEAFFIPASGQLNILDGKSWILITYGRGSDLATYTLQDALKVAEKVLKGQKS